MIGATLLYHQGVCKRERLWWNRIAISSRISAI
jgi:hypothetical protein